LPENQPIPSARITHGVHIHGEDIPLSNQRDYAIITEKYDRLFKSLGLELIQAVTNARQFSAKNIETVYIVGATIYGTALILGSLFRKFYIASGAEDITLSQYFTGSSYVINRYYSTESLDMVIHGFSNSRIRKMEQLKGWTPVYDNLHSCLNIPALDGINNCSECDKCLYTMTLLEALGELDKYTTLSNSIGYLEMLKISRKYNPAITPYLKNATTYARKNRPGFVLFIHLITLLGWIRVGLLRYLPNWIQTPIKRRFSHSRIANYFIKPPDEGSSD
jgi:hypothetical protein